MSIANSRTRRAEPRTGADLKRRGFKILALERPWGWSQTPRRDRKSPDYKLVSLEPGSDWYGIIKRNGARSMAHLMKPQGYSYKKPLGSYESNIAAAHAILDHLGYNEQGL